MRFIKPILFALLAIASISSASAQSLPGGFVYLRDVDPSIIQDIRYATSNNFVGRPLAGYGAGECVVKREVGLRLKAVQQELAAQNLSLKVFDCYRPARASLDMVRWSQNGHESAADRRYNPRIPKTELFRLGYIAGHSQHSTGGRRSTSLWSISRPTIPPKLIPRKPMPTARHRSRRGCRKAAWTWAPDMIARTRRGIPQHRRSIRTRAPGASGF